MKLTVKGAVVEVDDRHAKTPLLWVLLDVLELRETRVRLWSGSVRRLHRPDRRPEHEVLPDRDRRAVGKRVVTVEGASGPVVDAVRDAWYRGNVIQCRCCQPGKTLAAVALLESDESPDDATIRRWMNGNVCRCGTHPRISRRDPGGRRDAGVRRAA